MDKLRISASRLKVFLKCRWQYYVKYKLKLPDPGNDKSVLGTIIHLIYQCITDPTKKNRSQYVDHAIASGGLHPVIEKLYKKLYSKHAFAKDLYDTGVKLLLNGLIYGFEPNAKVLETEYNFEFDIGEGISTYGFIDKIQELDADTLEVRDYKSGAPVKPEDLVDDVQAIIYLHAVMQKYPKYKFYLFTFHFLKNKKCVTVTKSIEEIETFIEFLRTQAPLMRAVTKDNANCTRGFWCNFCYAKGPNKEMNYDGCPAFN